MHRKLRLAKTTVQSTDNQIGRDRGICRCRFCETLPAAPEYWPFAKQQKGAGGAGRDRSMPIQPQPWPELRCTFPEAFYIQPYTNRVPKKVGLVENQLWQILLLTVRNPLALLPRHIYLQINYVTVADQMDLSRTAPVFLTTSINIYLADFLLKPAFLLFRGSLDQAWKKA